MKMGLTLVLIIVAVSVGGAAAAEAEIHHVVVEIVVGISLPTLLLGFAYSAARESIVELGSKEEMEACDVSNPIRMANKMTSSSVENDSYAGKPHCDNSDDSNLDSDLVLGEEELSGGRIKRTSNRVRELIQQGNQRKKMISCGGEEGGGCGLWKRWRVAGGDSCDSRGSLEFGGFLYRRRWFGKDRMGKKRRERSRPRRMDAPKTDSHPRHAMEKKE
ncbi:hypothetical protein NE237_009980 [Protea cynaroides]|uniref:Uncharacterized protein n=1 Tax=Protea cynaroides TaxID=273540 RepID=A0A9Q0R187_9MAGN|nr:hypothetical protein NE237_009980 [Protea cynaroides]